MLKAWEARMELYSCLVSVVGTKHSEERGSSADPFLLTAQQCSPHLLQNQIVLTLSRSHCGPQVGDVLLVIISHLVFFIFASKIEIFAVKE